MKEKITIEVELPKERNPVAASLHAFTSRTEKKRKGKGSYRRKGRQREDRQSDDASFCGACA